MTRDQRITYNTPMDLIFKALNDPVRRSILDALRQKDGQTLTEIEQHFAMTRFGVMAHLRVLEDANLLTTRKVGRWKYHYLNAVPLQEVIDRWIEPLLSKPLAQGLSALKSHLEQEPAMLTQKPDFIHQTYIRATPQAIWHALTDPTLTRQYSIAGASVEGTPVTGGRLVWRRPDGTQMLSGTVLAADPPRKLDVTFEPHWGDDRTPSRALYILEPEGPLTKLTVEHYGLRETQQGVRDGWARTISGLKTLLETGTALTESA
ncbi:MAG: ArsR/SmtB family transcription factor [Paracoccaceae bacterium]